MLTREELVAALTARVRQRFQARGGVDAARPGEVNNAIMGEIRKILGSVDHPYTSIIRDWPGQAHQLDLCWWEEENIPSAIVLGLAGAILDFELRKGLGLPL